MKKIIFKTAKALLSVVALGFLVFAFWASFKQISDKNFSLNYPALFASGLCCLLFFYIQALGWKWCVQRMSHKLETGQCESTWFISQVVKYVPGKVMLPLYRVIYGSRMGVEKSKILLSLMVELVLMTISASMVFLAFSPFLSASVSNLYSLPLLVVCCGAGFLVIHPKVMNFGVNLALKIVKRDPVLIDFPYVFLLGLLGWFTLGWIVYGFASIFNVLAVAPAWVGQPEFYLITTALFALSWILGFLSFLTPGGIGVREFILGAMLIPYMAPGAMESIQSLGDIAEYAPEVLVVAVLSRIIWMAAEAVGALAWLPWRPKPAGDGEEIERNISI